MFVVLVVVVAINVVPLTQFWYKHTMHPHVQHVLVYYSHHQYLQGLQNYPFFYLQHHFILPNVYTLGL
jgi:hypothetical protein